MLIIKQFLDEIKKKYFTAKMILQSCLHTIYILKSIIQEEYLFRILVHWFTG